MAGAWLTRGPDATIRVVCIEVIVDLTHLERRLTGVIDSLPRKTTVNDVSNLLKAAKVRCQPDRKALARLEHDRV